MVNYWLTRAKWTKLRILSGCYCIFAKDELNDWYLYRGGDRKAVNNVEKLIRMAILQKLNVLVFVSPNGWGKATLVKDAVKVHDIEEPEC